MSKQTKGGPLGKFEILKKKSQSVGKPNGSIWTYKFFLTVKCQKKTKKGPLKEIQKSHSAEENPKVLFSERRFPQLAMFQCYTQIEKVFLKNLTNINLVLCDMYL